MVYVREAGNPIQRIESLIRVLPQPHNYEESNTKNWKFLLLIIPLHIIFSLNPIQRIEREFKTKLGYIGHTFENPIQRIERNTMPGVWWTSATIESNTKNWKIYKSASAVTKPHKCYLRIQYKELKAFPKYWTWTSTMKRIQYKELKACPQAKTP